MIRKRNNFSESSKLYACLGTFIDAVADELRYEPAHLMLYSATGCKRVPDKVDLIMAEMCPRKSNKYY